MSQSEEIKSKLDIVEVIREYIQLKPAGVNFRAKCPFHNEKTPSFVISPDKQIWHCFGCGKGGDVFSFVMEMEGLSFVETLRSLASKAGVVLKKSDPVAASKRNRLLDCLDLSARYFHATLLRSNEAEAAREYLKTRGLTEQTIEEWNIGYSSESWDDLANFLKKRNFTEEEIFSAGLSVRKEKGTGFYDRFRSRIMFPINDPNGNVAAFSARISPDKEETEKMGKYINSPQTMVYDKSRILFGLDKARQEIKRSDMAIVVEGQMDVITSHQAGFINTVASSGTALTGDQVALIKRYTKNLALAFDADSAGEMAAERGVREAMQAEMNVKIITIPEGKDPDECIKANPGEWKEAVASARPLFEYYLAKETRGKDMQKVENRVKAINRLGPFALMFANPVEREFWIRKLSRAVDLAEPMLKEQLAKFKTKSDYGNKQGEKNKGEAVLRPKNKEERQSELLLAIALSFPQNLEYAVNNIMVEQIADKDLKAIYRHLIIFYNNKGKDILIGDTESGISAIFYKEFRDWLAEALIEENSLGEMINKNNFLSHTYNKEDQLEELNLLDKLMLLGEKDFYDLSLEEAHKELLRIANFLKKASNLRRRKEIERQLSEIESGARTEDGDSKEEIDLLIKEQKMLNEEWSDLEKTSF